LDGVVSFNGLNEAIVLRIVKKNIDEFQKILDEKNIALKVTRKCYEWLAKKSFSDLFGAREVARMVEEKIKTFFVDEVLFGALASGGTVQADIKNDDVFIRKVD
jgi:ATP-dependent Clp protease ATP-binding subunit ClpA